MTRVRIYLVSGPKVNREFVFESAHTVGMLNGMLLPRAYDIIRAHPTKADVGKLFTWELSVVEK
jgi:hypothetical protein